MDKMKNDEGVNGPILPLKEPYKDERGTIQSLVALENPEIGSAVWIESKKDSVRANHSHKKDWHYCYVVSGRIEYYYRPAHSEIEPKKCIVEKGEEFYTPPMVEHAMVFPEDTIFLTLSGGTRSHHDYEADLVRVKVV